MNDSIVSPRAKPSVESSPKADKERWNEYFSIFWKLIYGTAVRSGLTDSEAQEVVQETVLSVIKERDEDFRRGEIGSGSLKRAMLAATRKSVEDRNRARASGRHGHGQANPDLEATWEREWERNLIDVALLRVRRRIDPKRYQVFDMRARKGWPLTRIVRTTGFSALRVCLTRLSVATQARREFKRMRAIYV